jgi:hypothetical protein
MNKLTKEQHLEFVNVLGEGVKDYITKINHHRGLWGEHDVKEIIDDCIKKVCLNRFGEYLPIEYVHTNNLPINDFYSTEVLINTLLTYCVYYDFREGHGISCSLSEFELRDVCLDLSFVSQYSKGINVVDGVVYILMDDCKFVKYKMGSFPFIGSTNVTP